MGEGEEKKIWKDERRQCRVEVNFEDRVGVSFGHVEFCFNRSLK